MTSVLNIESTIYQKLQEGLKIPVFNHVPDYAELPLVRIGKIDYQKWLMFPDTIRATFEISIFSEQHSNKEVIEIADKASALLFEIPQTFVSESSIHQFKDGTWCAELSVTLNQLQ